MGNLPSSTSTEPLAQGKHRNMSTISLPPTIPRRHNMKDSERKEIFPISDEGAPSLPGRRGSIGFFRGKRALAPVSIDHAQLFQNLQNLDLTHCSWQTHQCLSDSNPDSACDSLSTTPTTAATTPATTAAATPTTPMNHLGPHYGRPCSQPTSPVAASIQDYHPRQEQKLATFMKRNLLPPHALLTRSSTFSPSSDTTSSSTTRSNSTSSSPTIDCSSNSISPILPFCAQLPVPEHHHQSTFDQPARRPPLEHFSSGLDSIPSTLDVPCLPISEWGNRHRWSGEQDWADDIPEGLEHDGGPWEVMDSYTVEQHITRALFKGQNYSAPLDFARPTIPNDQDCRPEQAFTAQDRGLSFPQSTSHNSMATLDSRSGPPSMAEERSLVILSVGCGNSQWATEMALAHPQSAIHAINVSQIASLPALPETTPTFDLDNLFFYNLDDNSLRIPFVSNSVDYIHVRRFLPNVNKTKYLAFLRELVRVLKVDGYLELVELDLRLRDSGLDNCWPSYWTLIGFDKLGIDTSLALNLAGILRTMPGVEVSHKSSVNMPVGIHGGRIGLAAELLCWRSALTVRPWLMRQAMLSGAEFDELLERAREESRSLKSYQVCHVAVARKTAETFGSVL